MDLPMPASALEGLGPVQLEPTGVISWDKVVGGIFLGGIYLTGGEPGSGKSTIYLMIQGAWNKTERLYISSEETREAVAARSIRFGVPDVPIIAQPELGAICELVSMTAPGTLIAVDSLQKIRVHGAQMGGVTALRTSVEELKKARERSHSTLLLVSHVTKDDDFAGPKTIEHDVDVTVMMTKIGQARILRCDNKNRFAPTGRTAWMRMTAKGLEDASPELILPPEHLPGRVLTITESGLPAEVQAARRPGGLTIGIAQERARLACMLLGTTTEEFTIRADGDELEHDPLCDLAILLAIASERVSKPLPQKCCAWGQLTLDGRIIPGTGHDERAQAARDLELVPTFSPDSVKTIEDALEAVGLLDALGSPPDEEEP
jgi:DNA repair protein RadA/Sms